MKKLSYSALATVICLAFGASAIAAPITKAEYKAAKTEISAKYTADKNACKPNAGNAKDICIEEAKGREKIANAENEAAYSPSVKHTYDVRAATADAAYAVAKEKCDDLSGNPKDVCRKEAKSAHVAALADAKVSEKTSDANAKAQDKSASAKAAASATKTEARKDAATDKRDADYAVAKEKCDALAGDAKTTCVNDAKKRYGKN